MLKWIFSLVLLSSVVLNTVNAPPASADSTQVLITHVQAGANGGAAKELVAIYNNSPQEVSITDWCITNKSSTSFACFLSEVPGQDVMLPGFAYALAVSDKFSKDHGGFTRTIYTPSNGSFGSITGGGDIITLIDSNHSVIDSIAWTKTLAGGEVLVRDHDPVDPNRYIDTDDAGDFKVALADLYPEDQTYLTEPEYVEEEEQAPILPVTITELLPNAKGTDKGNEYIELYNPNDTAIKLSNYQLLVGIDNPKSYTLPDILIEPGQYLYFSDTQLGYALANSSGKAAIMDVIGNLIYETDVYSNPKDDMAWALIDGVWQYTNQPTPGLKNTKSKIIYSVIKAKTSTLKPCAQNQYRNPETNRCRTIQLASKELTPCQPGQERNPDTNRCRKIQSSQSIVSECPEGKVRNPETNRCRNEIKMSDADYGVKGQTTEVSNSNWYIWAAIGVAVLAGLSYAAWEWRKELIDLLVNLRSKFRIR